CSARVTGAFGLLPVSYPLSAALFVIVLGVLLLGVMTLLRVVACWHVLAFLRLIAKYLLGRLRLLLCGLCRRFLGSNVLFIMRSIVTTLPTLTALVLLFTLVLRITSLSLLLLRALFLLRLSVRLTLF